MYLFRDISRWSVFGWSLWEKIEDARLAFKTNQIERWHLRELHSSRRVKYLARWLCSHVDQQYRHGRVEVTSTWIDQYPKAHTMYAASQSSAPAQVSVELADTLVLVRVEDNLGATLTERAVLLQAKCSNKTDELEPSSPGSSTDNERKLLECCCDLIKVTSDTSRNSAPINPIHPTYDLGTSTSAPGLNTFARYLLIPRKRKSAGLPYMLLWPTSLNSLNGQADHIGDAMLAMAGMPSKSPVVGKSLSGQGVPPDWKHLVDDLISYCKSRNPINRFSSSGKPIPRLIRSGPYTASFRRALFYIAGIVLGAAVRRTCIERLLVCQLVGDTNNIPPFGPNEPSRNEPDDEPIGGFGVISVTITVPGPIKEAPRAE